MPDRFNTLNITVWLSVNKPFTKYVSNMTSVTCGTGTAYHSGATEFIRCLFFGGICVTISIVCAFVLLFLAIALSVVLRVSGSLHCLSFYEFQVHFIVCRSTSFRFITLSVVLRVSGSLHCLSFYEFQVHYIVCLSASFRFIAMSVVLRVSGSDNRVGIF
jgi:hypothetical protein